MSKSRKSAGYIATARRPADASATGRGRQVYLAAKKDGDLTYTPNRHQAAVFTSEKRAMAALANMERVYGLVPGYVHTL